MTVDNLSFPRPAVARPPARAGGGVLVTPCFAAATFLGAFLLFLVQPLIAKYVLPWFGGGAAVWASCLLFFQAALLAGYLYAHLGVRRLPRWAQDIVHVVVLLAAVAVALPSITPSAQWQPPPDGAGQNPTWRIVLLLAVTVGLPCVALAATSPLLHAWYVGIRPGTAVYRLYALSNAGSLLALLAYPLVVERYLTRAAQAQMWSIGLAAFAVLCGACAFIAWRDRAVDDAAPATPPDAVRDTVTPAHPRVVGILWLLLPTCASALLLGMTNAITQDLAPGPLLWIVPLALYLLTFIIAFDHPRWYLRPLWGVLLAIGIGATWYILKSGGRDLLPTLIIATLGFTLFAACMVLHGELARLKPPTDRLTSYYLTIAAGGALGGLLVAVVAPLVLSSYSELPIALWACCVLGVVTPYAAAGRLPTGLPAALGLLAIVGASGVLWSADHRLLSDGALLARERDFYGVVSVWETEMGQGKGVVMIHGGTLHGHQYRRPSLRGTPTTYYYPATGVGRLLGDGSPLGAKPRRVAAVGLGTGSIAAYARPGDEYRFYEISPNVLKLARQHFTYLEDATDRGAQWDAVVGDARLALEREPDGTTFDVIVLDAFSGDAVPVHLLTLEAFRQLYQPMLAPDGVLAVHVSNKYLRLAHVPRAAADHIGWHVLLHRTAPPDPVNSASEWVLLTPDAARAKQLVALGATHPPAGWEKFEPWTDERANVLGVLRR